MPNKCARCRKSEIFGRAFEHVGEASQKLTLCVECSQLIYKAIDARKAGNSEKENELREKFVTGIKESPQKSVLLKWYYINNP